ncbi:MAG: helix-turn-helix transcriptional regulator [Candidatus Limnocylindrales bacterium]
MDIGKVSGIEFGAMVRGQRESRGLDLDALCAAIGGTPGIGFLGRLEDGLVGPSSSLITKISTALGLPVDLMLNAGGFATENQRLDALVTLAASVPPPRKGEEA